MIQYTSILETCDELFEWIDLTTFIEVNIVIMTKGHVIGHYTYFELIDVICEGGKYIRGDMFFADHHLPKHPKYKQYLKWKEYSKMEKNRIKQYERLVYESEENQLLTVKSRQIKKKFYC